VSETDTTENERQQMECFSNCKQISNTRENHYYIPLNGNTMTVSKVPASNIFSDRCLKTVLKTTILHTVTSSCAALLPTHMVGSNGLML
jgi:hypothetical protein